MCNKRSSGFLHIILLVVTCISIAYLIENFYQKKTILTLILSTQLNISIIFGLLIVGVAVLECISMIYFKQSTKPMLGIYSLLFLITFYSNHIVKNGQYYLFLIVYYIVIMIAIGITAKVAKRYMHVTFFATLAILNFFDMTLSSPTIQHSLAAIQHDGPKFLVMAILLFLIYSWVIRYLDGNKIQNI